MPSVSKAQQRFMGIVRSIQKGNAKASDYSKEIRSAAKSMKKKDVKDFADTDRKGLPEERDYKDEYKKFQSSTKSKQYRAELNKYNRKKGTYGNGDGKDASHKGGKIMGFEKESTNRGRAEKSRLKKETANEGSFKTTLRPQKKDINKMKVRFKSDPRRVYTLKSVETGRVGGTSYMFAAPGNRKEHFTPKTWDLANKKGWLSLESVNEGGMGILDKDQTDVLHGIVMKNKSKNSKVILSIVIKDKMFKGVDKKELLGYIEGAKQFVKYMKSESVNEGNLKYVIQYKKDKNRYLSNKSRDVKKVKDALQFKSEKDAKNQLNGLDWQFRGNYKIVKLKESVNESKELDTIEKIVKSAKNFMDVGRALKKVRIKSDFQTSMGLPRYTFKLNGKRYGILNKKNVSKPDRVVGDIAFGVMESVNEAKIAHSKGGYVEVGKWYLLNYGKWKDTVKVVSIDSKGMKVYNPNDNWRYTIPMTMIKKKKIGGYMTPIDESVNEAVKFDSIQPKDTIDYGYAQYYVAKNDGKNIHMGLVAKKKATGGMFASDAKLSKSNFDSQIRVKFIKRVLRNGKPLKESVNEKISKEEWSEYPKYARKLKPYMRRLLKIPVKVRVIKQANHNPWIDVRVARSGKDVIPNDFRKRALKVIGGGRARDMDNINYGNIRTGSVSLKYDEWVKLLGNKVK